MEIKTVEEYISEYPAEIQDKLKKIREIIKAIAPDAMEGIAYGMPGYKIYNKPLVYFAGFKNHIGFYATPTGHEKFKTELSKYKQGKGSVQFPNNQPLPVELITEIVKFRLAENRLNAKK